MYSSAFSQIIIYHFDLLFDRGQYTVKNCPRYSYRAKYHLLSVSGQKNTRTKLYNKNMGIAPYTITPITWNIGTIYVSYYRRVLSYKLATHTSILLLVCVNVFLTPNHLKDCSLCLLVSFSSQLSWKVYKDTFSSQCTHTTSVHTPGISDSEHVVCLPPCGNNEKPHGTLILQYEKINTTDSVSERSAGKASN